MKPPGRGKRDISGIQGYACHNYGHFAYDKDKFLTATAEDHIKKLVANDESDGRGEPLDDATDNDGAAYGDSASNDDYEEVSRFDAKPTIEEVEVDLGS